MHDAQAAPASLADGSTPLGPDDLFARLDALDVTHRTVSHAPVFTVDEANRMRGRVDGGHSKNLFVRDKKQRHWLVACLAERRVDLKWLARELGTGRLTFCSRRRLTDYLGILPGSVSPFAVINDRGGVVQVAVDEDLLAHDPVNFHPLDNSRTTAVSRAGLLRFLEAENHPPRLLRFPERMGPQTRPASASER